MKKTVSFSIIALIGLVAIAATMKISDYPAKTFLTGTELFLLADGATNAKMTATSLNASLTNVAGLKDGAIIRSATLTNAINTSGSVVAAVISAITFNIGTLTVTNPPYLNLVNSTNLTYRMTTNWASAFAWGRANITNLTGDVTLPLFAAPDTAHKETMTILCVPDGSPRTVTLPAGVRAVGGARSWVATNGTVRSILIECENGYTNAASVTYY